MAEKEYKPIHKSTRVVALDDKEFDELRQQLASCLDALKELTKQTADLAKAVKGMKESHDKWVRAGKFIIPLIATGYVYASML